MTCIRTLAEACTDTLPLHARLLMQARLRMHEHYCTQQKGVVPQCVAMTGRFAVPALCPTKPGWQQILCIMHDLRSACVQHGCVQHDCVQHGCVQHDCVQHDCLALPCACMLRSACVQRVTAASHQEQAYTVTSCLPNLLAEFHPASDSPVPCTGQGQAVVRPLTIRLTQVHKRCRLLPVLLAALPTRNWCDTPCSSCLVLTRHCQQCATI
jgi:hypothetical protein